MRIRITREHDGRHRLVCIRRNGTWTQGELGPGLPYHDLAHYVVERELQLREGVFGLIDAGRGIAELGDPEVVRTLPREALVAEVLTRALQGLSNGAVAQRDFGASVEEELGTRVRGLDDAAVQRMLATYIQLLNAWEGVAEGASLELRWP